MTKKLGRPFLGTDETNRGKVPCREGGASTATKIVPSEKKKKKSKNRFSKKNAGGKEGMKRKKSTSLNQKKIAGAQTKLYEQREKGH